MESGVDKRLHEAPAFYTLYTALIAIGALTVIFLSSEKQIPIALLSQVINGMLLPVVLIFMLRLVNRKDLMGDYRNNRTFNIIAWVCCVTMIVLTLIWFVSTFFPGHLPT